MTVYSAFTRRGWLLDGPKRPLNNADPTYFETLRTPTEAYAYGLFLTDGYVRPGRWSIKLQSSDEPVLVDISKSFYSGAFAVSGPSKSLRIYREKNASIFQGNSRPVASRLLARFPRNKTSRSRAGFDTTKPAMRPALLRGIFDGDGSISARSARPNQRQVNICSINRKFLEEIQEWLSREHRILASISTERRAGKWCRTPSGWSVNCKDMYRLVFTTHESRVALYRLMYLQDDGPRIERKFREYTSYYENAVQLLACKKPELPATRLLELHQQHLAGRSLRSIGRELDRGCMTISRWFSSQKLAVKSRVTHRP